MLLVHAFLQHVVKPRAFGLHLRHVRQFRLQAVDRGLHSVKTIPRLRAGNGRPRTTEPGIATGLNHQRLPSQPLFPAAGSKPVWVQEIGPGC